MPVRSIAIEKKVHIAVKPNITQADTRLEFLIQPDEELRVKQGGDSK